MKKPSYTSIAKWVLAFTPLIITAIFYNTLPLQIPTHWGINGNVTYSQKPMIWLLSSISLIMTVLLNFMPKIDPKRENYVKFSNAYNGFVIILSLFFNMLILITISESLQPGRISIGNVVNCSVAILFIYIGNIMPKMKQNYFFGIKTPWTLANSEVWNKTHRIGGFIWFIAGIFMFISSFLFSDKVLFILLLILVFACSIIPLIISYIFYKRERND